MAIAGALFLGQGLIMNIYYSKKQCIDIPKFWSEILKMSMIPIALTIASIFAIKHHDINSWSDLVISIIIFCAIYIPLFWSFSMNQYEKDLLMGPIKIYISKLRFKK
jgi:nitrogen fixation-related uncharacterized protein